jgi:hypothetical protein
MRFTKEQVKGFSDAAQPLKLYRRAELVDEQTGKQMISELYVDPLPEDAVLNGILKPNTTIVNSTPSKTSTPLCPGRSAFEVRI